MVKKNAKEECENTKKRQYCRLYETLATRTGVTHTKGDNCARQQPFRSQVKSLFSICDHQDHEDVKKNRSKRGMFKKTNKSVPYVKESQRKPTE